MGKTSYPICQRIAQVRHELHGPRGKVHFAKRLGISASTYNYYENNRVPPVDLLVKIADLACLDLRWLLTGELSAAPVPATHPAVQRIVALLRDRPQAAEPLAAFVDLLSASLTWPAKQAQAVSGQARAGRPARATDDQHRPTAIAPVAAQGAEQPADAQVLARPSQADKPAQASPPAESDSLPPPGPLFGPRQWIPVLGRSAAGVPHFWSHEAAPAGLTLLSDLVARHARRVDRRVLPATTVGEAASDSQNVQIICLNSPDADNVVEFVAAPALKCRHPDAFAVRIDGDSMAPEISHGEIVICSPAIAAVDGRPALVQLKGQIGVTCKIVRLRAGKIHLIPINERYAAHSFAMQDVVWSARVLARVRPR